MCTSKQPVVLQQTCRNMKRRIEGEQYYSNTAVVINTSCTVVAVQHIYICTCTYTYKYFCYLENCDCQCDDQESFSPLKPQPPTAQQSQQVQPFDLLDVVKDIVSPENCKEKLDQSLEKNKLVDDPQPSESKSFVTHTYVVMYRCT